MAMRKKMSELLEKLKDDLAEVEWEGISPHLERDGVIIVDDALDLVEVATCVSEDDSKRVGEWIAVGKLVKPTKEQTEEWDKEPKKLFSTLIVKPFVLIQLPRQ
jgi:hypothetical protein